MTQDELSVHDTLNLVVDIPHQRLDLVENGSVIATYPVSTSRFGIGSDEGSLKTPIGMFRIAEKIGHGADLSAVFKGRKPTGDIAPPGGDEDLVLTRILWLEGCDEHNANTRDRYIYIHGTNQEHLIGTPASHGCVRMKNTDIVDLFERVPEGTPLRILT